MASPWAHAAASTSRRARRRRPESRPHTPSTRPLQRVRDVPRRRRVSRRTNAGAQIFECIGLHPEVVDVAFKGTASRVGGLDFAELQKETASLVKDSAYGGLSDDDVKVFKLSNYGFINALQKGRGGEEHANSPSRREVVPRVRAGGRSD